MNDKVNKLKTIYYIQKVNKENILKYIIESIIEDDKEILKIKLNFLNFIIDIEEFDYEILSENDFWFNKISFDDNSDYDIIRKFYDLIIKIIESKIKGDEKKKLLLSFFEKEEKYKEIFYLIYTFINNQRNEQIDFLNDDESLFLFIYFVGGKTQKFLKTKFIDKCIFYLEQLDTDYSNLNFQILNIKLLTELNKCALSSNVINYKLAFENEKRKLSKNIENDKKEENKLTTNINSKEIKEEKNELKSNLDNKLFENKNNNFELNSNINEVSKQQNNIDNQDFKNKSNKKSIIEDKKNNVQLNDITIDIEKRKYSEKVEDKTYNEKNNKNLFENINIHLSTNYINELKENELKENELKENELKENELKENELKENELKENELKENELKENALKENELKENELKENKLKENELKENELKENKLKENKLKENKLKENKLKENKLKENELKENELKENKSIDIIINDFILILSKLNDYNTFQLDGINIKKVKIKYLIIKYLQIENYISSLINRIIFTNNIQENLFSLSNNIFKLENENGLLKIDLIKLKILIEKLKIPNLINLKRKIIDIILFEISTSYHSRININEYNPDKRFLNQIKLMIEKKIDDSKKTNKDNNFNNELNKKLDLINECLKKGYKEGNLYIHSISGINGKIIKYLIDCLYYFKNQLNPIVHIGKGNGKFYLLPKAFYNNKDVINNYSKLFLEMLDENNADILNNNIISKIPEIKKFNKSELINFCFENEISLKILKENFIEQLKKKLLSPLNVFFFQINFFHSNILNCFSNSNLKQKINIKIENYQKLIKSLFDNMYTLFIKGKITKELLQGYKNYLTHEFEIISHIIEEDDLKQQLIKKIYHCLQFEIIDKHLNMLIEKLKSEEEERKNINKNLINEYLNNIQKIKDMIFISNNFFNSFENIFNKWKGEKNIQEKDFDFSRFKHFLFIILPEKTFDIEFEYNFTFKESVWLVKNGLLDIIIN